MAITKKSILRCYLDLQKEYITKYGKVALLYQIGSFYELYSYDEDNGLFEQIRKDIGLNKTKCTKKLPLSENNPYMSGFPDHSLNTFVEELLKFNYTVVVYSQDEHDKKVRKLDRIISPGININDKSDNIYIGAIYVLGEKDSPREINLCLIDLTTGKVICYSLGTSNLKNIKNVLSIYEPKELVNINDNFKCDIDSILIHKYNLDKNITKESYQLEFLKKIYPNTEPLSVIEYINMERFPFLLQTFIVLLNFVHEHDSNIVYHIEKPKIKQFSRNMFISYKTLSQLNVINATNPKFKSLFNYISHTSTIGGKRLLKERLNNPIISIKKLKQRYDDIDHMNYEDYEKLLCDIIDIEKFHRKIFLGILKPEEFISLNVSYKNISKIFEIHQNIPKKVKTNFYEFMEFYKDRLSFDDKIFKDGYNSDIDDLSLGVKKSFEKIENIRKEIFQKLSQKLSDDNIKLSNTNSEGYFFVLTKKRYELIKDQKFSAKVQSNNVKITNDEIREASYNILSYTEQLYSMKKNIFKKFLSEITIKYEKLLRKVSKIICNIDVIKSLKKVSKLYNYSRPQIIEKHNSFLNIKDLRHPILERIDGKFTPNDVSLSNDNNILLFGINGCGKSILLSSIGLSIIMAQSGCFVPAKEFVFCPFENLITKISMADDLYQHKSTFECELSDLKNMLHFANRRTLILGDELCSGTEYVSAISIVSAMILTLIEKKATFLLTTHLHQLSDNEIISNNKKLKFFHLSVDFNEKIIYHHKLCEGKCQDLYGLDIAIKALKNNTSFIQTANNIRNTLIYNKKILSTKQSKYNKDVYVDRCSNCGSKKNLHTHHIKQQCLADKNNMIDGHHKNHRSNLQVLCESCHKDHHNKRSS